MKVKILSLIAGAIALSLTATPFAVKAQTNTQQTPTQEVAPKPKKGIWQNLGLTDAQKTQMQEIRRNTRTQIEGILTPTQREQFNAANQSGQRRGKPFASLNLTEDQKTQMRQIKESSQKQIEAILTPSQQQQLQQFRENMRSRRQQRNPTSTPTP